MNHTTAQHKTHNRIKNARGEIIPFHSVPRFHNSIQLKSIRVLRHQTIIHETFRCVPFRSVRLGSVRFVSSHHKIREKPCYATKNKRATPKTTENCENCELFPVSGITWWSIELWCRTYEIISVYLSVIRSTNSIIRSSWNPTTKHFFRCDDRLLFVKNCAFFCCTKNGKDCVGILSQPTYRLLWCQHWPPLPAAGWRPPRMLWRTSSLSSSSTSSRSLRRSRQLMKKAFGWARTQKHT